MPLLYVLSDNDEHELATQFCKYTHMYRHKYENTLFLTPHILTSLGGSMTVQMTTELLLMATAFQYLRVCAGKIVCSLPALFPHTGLQLSGSTV